MKTKVLYILSSYNIYGGTPKKTLDLMKSLKEDSVLYIYHNSFPEFKADFENSGGKIYEGFYGYNLYMHLKALIKIIDRENVNIIQTQFQFGELLALIVKLIRPKIKLVIAFVNSFSPSFWKRKVARIVYRKTDHFVYISNYVKIEKERQFSLLRSRQSTIIYNGTRKRTEDSDLEIILNKNVVLDIAGLSKIKNTQVLIWAFDVIVNQKKRKDFHLYLVGDGPLREEIEFLIKKLKLENNVELLGYRKDVGRLLDLCDIFVHPCFMEGFGIVVAEAMIAEKPIIVSNAGALPELIEHGKTGMVVDPFEAEDWANTILEIADDGEKASELAKNARIKAEDDFSVSRFVSDYVKLYKSLMVSEEK